MTVKARDQNLVIGDTVALSLFVFNSNATANIYSITSVEIFYLDPTLRTPANPLGKTLIETIPGASVISEVTGDYEYDLYIDPTLYTETGHYNDSWTVTFVGGEQPAVIEQWFTVFPPLWYTSPTPILYDFAFYFQPNRLRYGCKQYLYIEVTPNVPTASTLENYYVDLLINSNLNISIAQRCGDCLSCDPDLNLIVDNQPTTYTSKNRAYYWLDTTTFDCGVYDIWFTLNFGANVYVSEKNQMQIFS